MNVCMYMFAYGLRINRWYWKLREHTGRPPRRWRCSGICSVAGWVQCFPSPPNCSTLSRTRPSDHFCSRRKRFRLYRVGLILCIQHSSIDIPSSIRSYSPHLMNTYIYSWFIHSFILSKFEIHTVYNYLLFYWCLSSDFCGAGESNLLFEQEHSLQRPRRVLQIYGRGDSHIRLERAVLRHLNFKECKLLIV